MDDKVKAIANAPSPTNMSELKSYLLLINYYQKFLPTQSVKCTLSFALVAAEEQQLELGPKRTTKLYLKSSKLLVHYDNQYKLTLACYAS